MRSDGLDPRHFDTGPLIELLNGGSVDGVVPEIRVPQAALVPAGPLTVMEAGAENGR
jgi:hypothetical protein